MFPQKHINGFEKYWRRRKPGTSTAVHYSSDVRIFFNWATNRTPETITVHDVDGFIEWQQSLGRAPATIRRRLIALRMFYDYLAYACDKEVPNPVIARRHYHCWRDGVSSLKTFPKSSGRLKNNIHIPLSAKPLGGFYIP
jgi:site-specific recombinase XerD